mgnify:CR=1 FL=1
MNLLQPHITLAGKLDHQQVSWERTGCALSALGHELFPANLGHAPRGGRLHHGSYQICSLGLMHKATPYAQG